MGAYVDGKPFSVELVAAVGRLVDLVISTGDSDLDRL